MSLHHKYSPSSAHRWMHCHGSVAAIEGDVMPPAENEEFSNEGTVAHQLAAEVLLKEKALSAIPDTEMRDAISLYVEYVSQYQGQLSVESKLKIIATDGFGTADAIVVAPDRIHVFDFKYGLGNRVRATGNEQLMLYACGVKDELDYLGIEDFTLHVVQPRLDSYPTVDVTLADINAFEADVRHAIEQIEAGSTDRTPGYKQCQWCPMAGRCGPLSRQLFAVFSQSLENIPFWNPEEMDVGEAAALYLRAGEVRNWIRGVEQYIEGLVLAGTDVPGVKLVEKRTYRTWDDPELAAETMKSLGVDPYKPAQVISPAALEKELGKKAVANDPALVDNIIKPPGGPTVAPETDPRPAYQSDGFDNLDQPETEK